MSIIIDDKTRVVVQGITGGEGTFHTQRMQEYGTTVVAGVTPGKGGTTHLNVPVYNSVADAVEKEGADASAIFVPAFFAADAIMEAASAGIKCIVCITEGIPTFDMIKAKLFLNGKDCCLIGPNTPGNHISWKVQNRDNAWPYSYSWNNRHYIPLRHTDLRGCRPGDEVGIWTVDCSGYRR